MQVRKFLLLTIFLICVPAIRADAQRPMTPRDLWSMGRVSSPTLSPDGKTVLYTVQNWDLAALKAQTDLYSVPVTGGTPTLVHASANSPAYSPDGKQLAYITDGQVYIGDRKVTNLPNGAGGPIVWSHDGTKLLVNSSVTPDDSLAHRFAALAKGKSQARIYDDLGYRHWNEWNNGDRSHVFVVDVASGMTRDVTPGSFDSPPIALEGFQDYDISPDGSEIAYAANKHVPTMVGTGNDVYLTTSASDGGGKVMVANEANDNSPVYSPDGKYIAWIAMERPAFESDLARLKIYNRASGQVTDLTGALDLPVGEFKWSPDSKTLYFTVQDQLYNSLFKVGLDGKAPVRITANQFISGFAVAPDGRTIVVAKQSVASPVELFAIDAKGNTLRQLTHVNDDLLKQLALQPVEPFWFTGAEGAKVEGFIVKPPHFDASKKYPVVFVIHGGPQGAWEDSWSYRWNPNQLAAPGYVIVTVNPRGSTGYGQKFTDEISRDWGGKVYTDLMNGLDYALQNNSYMNANDVAAAGASYGGYMINWINGHTDRFKALILHDGIFNTESAYGSTEELWFPEWEFGGLPWQHPELYEKWNPANYAQNMKTPTLVIHGALDYRLPLAQGLIAFTTLRRQGVPARLLVFPDEGHWVLKPANAFVWWGEMLGWLARYLRTAD